MVTLIVTDVFSVNNVYNFSNLCISVASTSSRMTRGPSRTCSCSCTCLGRCLPGACTSSSLCTPATHTRTDSSVVRPPCYHSILVDQSQCISAYFHCVVSPRNVFLTLSYMLGYWMIRSIDALRVERFIGIFTMCPLYSA